MYSMVATATAVAAGSAEKLIGKESYLCQTLRLIALRCALACSAWQGSGMGKTEEMVGNIEDRCAAGKKGAKTGRRHL